MPENIDMQLREAIERAPTQFRKALIHRASLGEFNLCKEQGLRLITYALEHYPDKAEQVLSVNYNQMDHWQVRKKIQRLVPNFTQTPFADAIRKSFEGYDALLSGTSKLGAVLQKYPLPCIPKSRRGIAVMQVLGLKEQLESWLSGEENPHKLLSHGDIIDVEARVVTQSFAATDTDSDNLNIKSIDYENEDSK